MKQFLIKIPPWERRLLVVVTKDRQNVLNLVKKYKLGRDLRNQIFRDPVSIGDGGATYTDKVHGRFIIWFPEWKNSWDDIDTLVHETNHLVKFLMKFVGATNETEASAYTQEFLFRTIRHRLSGKPSKEY